MRFAARALLAAALAVLAAAAGAQVPGSCRGEPFTWQGRNVLWLGTSIPHQGIRDGSSYPELFCRALGCRVVNKAFSGSRMRWDEERAEDSCGRGRNAPKGLSATRRELQARIQAAGPDDGSSSYHASCNPAVRPGAMGYEDRINLPWSQTPFDVVVLDHGHNDRPAGAARDAAFGTLDPKAIPLSAVQRGSPTRLVLPAGHGLRVTDDISVRTPGLAGMDYWTGEVSSVDGNTVTIPFDSRTITGSLASGGAVVRFDKTRLYDAYNLVISDILHMAASHGARRVPVVLVTPPTEWTGGRNDGSVAAVNQALARVAEKWGLPLYDMTADLHIGRDDLFKRLPDGVHPTTRESREWIAAHVADWARRTTLAFDGCRGRWQQQ
jgi:hypothetical protein